MNTSKADDLRKKWYANADNIAEFLAVINPYWCEQKWRDMMYSHLSMTEKEAGIRLKKEYPKDIEIFEYERIVTGYRAAPIPPEKAFGAGRRYKSG